MESLDLDIVQTELKCEWCHLQVYKRYIINTYCKFQDRIMCEGCITNKYRRRALFKLRTFPGWYQIRSINQTTNT